MCLFQLWFSQGTCPVVGLLDHMIIYGASQVVLMVRNAPANARDIRGAGSIPGLERSPGEGYGNPLQNSYLENPMDRGAWQAMVHGVTKSRTQLK